MKAIKIPADIQAMSFEKAVAELETLVAKMEAGSQTLEELTANFERGCYLNEHCRKQLNSLERKISLFSGNPNGQEDCWVDFDTETDSNRENELPF